MGRTYDNIDQDLRTWIEGQRMFFVATAPVSASGHVNVSPKGLDTLRVLNSHAIAYLDHVASGVETIAHVRENGRIVVMLCAFEGPPRIVRLHGQGSVFEPQDPRYAELRGMFPPDPPGRAIIHVAVARVSDSCGFGVPIYRYEGQRSQLAVWAQRKGADGLAEYQRERNRFSIDGLPTILWIEQSHE